MTDKQKNTENEAQIIKNEDLARPVSYTHLTLPTIPTV